MQKIILLVLVLSLTCTHYAVAQQAAKPAKQNTKPAPPPDVEDLEGTKIDQAPRVLPFDSSAAPNDALTKAIQQMLEQTNAVNMGLEVAGKLVKQQQAGNTNSSLDPFYSRFSEELKSDRVKALFGNMFVKIYRKYYTLEEVQQLTAFYKTPLGKKTLQVTPASLQETQMEGGKLGELIAMEILKELNLD